MLAFTGFAPTVLGVSVFERDALVHTGMPSRVARIGGQQESATLAQAKLTRNDPPVPAGNTGRKQNGRLRQEAGRVTPVAGYSHAMVTGGLLVTSSTTRLTPSTSLVIRLEIRASRS